MTIDNKVLAGREAAANYRDAHARLYAEGWKGKMEDEHERLLLNLNVELKALGFDSVDTFFKASADENARELGCRRVAYLKRRPFGRSGGNGYSNS
jgi:hypothetical protein